MDFLRRYGTIFRLHGTNQLQRLPVPLESTYIQPDERSLSDLLTYAKRLAAQLRFYNLSGQAAGDWQAIFTVLEDSNTGNILSTNALEKLLNSKNDWPAHITLLITLLKLFQYLQTDINELPIRHLRHYYENQLALLRREPVLDSVHVTFELAKNAAPTLLPAGTLLDAGKDSEANTLSYRTGSDIVISHASVKEQFRLLKETDKRGNARFFISQSIAEQEGDSWYTFGKNQLKLADDQRFMQEAALGFAIAAPVLLLAEGNRNINIVLQLHSAQQPIPAGHQLGFALDTQISGEEGWFSPDLFSAQLINNGVDPASLNINITANESSPAIIAADQTLHSGAPSSPWPVLRFLLKGESGHYAVLEGLQVTQISIHVDVQGVKNLLLQNEQGQLKAEKPIPLFGSQPRIGSAFYLGSDEIFSKRLTSITLQAQWLEKPVDLFNYYREYFSFVNDDLEQQFVGDFKVDVQILYKRSWITLLNNWNLFNYSQPENFNFPINLSDQSVVDYYFGENNYQAHSTLAGTSLFDHSSQYGFLRVLLTGPSYGSPYASDIAFNAFGHTAFAPRYSIQAIELGRDDEQEIALPNQAYTPTLGDLSVDYSASCDFVPGADLTEESFFTIDAFGYYEADQTSDAYLLPTIDGQASLLIGIENSSIPSNISLLLQLDKGTALSSGEPLAAGETRWSYLATNKWQAISSTDILIDNTHGFQQPGLISLSIASDASQQHQLMPSELLWIKATIDKPADSACRLLNIHAGATLAQLDVADSELDKYSSHLQTGLAAETINKLKQRNAAIKKVNQPYPSYGAAVKEADQLFFQSSSERLRHRNRAITLWDMERLILNQFPEVFKVKCLPHSDASGNNKAGELALVIIPDLRTVQTVNPLEPRADTLLMRAIESYIATLACPFATIHIIHPVFEHIRVDAQIAFVSGVDAGYYSKLLNEELQKYLSPWAYQEGQDIVFGTRIYRSEILAFLEGRTYIDFITRFTLYHVYNGPLRGGVDDMTIEVDFVVQANPTSSVSEMQIEEDFIIGSGVEVAQTTQAHAILVSHQQHRITPYDSNNPVCKGVDQLGIGYLTIELDFNVAAI